MTKLRITKLGGRLMRSVSRAFVVGFFLATFPLSAQESEEEARAYLDRLEWRGVLVLPGETQFSFYDEAGERGFWIKMNQIRNGIEITEYDALDERVTLRRGRVTRTLTLNESAVQTMDEAIAAAPPPLVVIGQPEPEPAEEEEESGEIPAGTADLWSEAIQQSAQLREIDQQFRNVNAEETSVREALSVLSPDDPAYSTLEARAREIREQRRMLTEGALTELENVPGLSEEAGISLREGLAAGFSRELQMPERSAEEPGEDVGEDRPN